MCLICEKVFSNESMKPSRLQENLKRVRAHKSKKDMAYFQSLWEKFRKRPTLRSMVSSALQEENDGLLASYNISLIIAKSGKPHSIGKELLLPVISEVLRTLLHISPTEHFIFHYDRNEKMQAIQLGVFEICLYPFTA
ncbi:hypothetical protein M513_10918 [Trichuris suis]|uniref:Uncharacterized protein n=1 Tax=Trichuris suis TaxID=68888 RepID=A0A085LTA8_9BILA|nr:hypothetical protein M513_10918 [Trichuris suis]